MTEFDSKKYEFELRVNFLRAALQMVSAGDMLSSKFADGPIMTMVRDLRDPALLQAYIVCTTHSRDNPRIILEACDAEYDRAAHAARMANHPGNHWDKIAKEIYG